jgi:hypothetical protein
MEVEHYIDGQHNGGVYNSFNHNTYGYCYQSPVKLVDPNGKQTTSKTMFGVGGLMHQSYNYYNVPNIKPVAQVKAKLSLGVQIGIKGSIGIVKGKVEAGIITMDVASTSIGTKGLKAVEWGDGTIHNFIGGEATSPVKLGNKEKIYL